MSPEQQRIAIAEACGWKWMRWGEGGDLFLVRPDFPSGTFVTGIRGINENFRSDDWPDYLNDLNAMHSSLQSQNQAFRTEFDGLLHATAEEKRLLITELDAKDWADCFISCLQNQRDSAPTT